MYPRGAVGQVSSRSRRHYETSTLSGVAELGFSRVPFARDATATAARSLLSPSLSRCLSHITPPSHKFSRGPRSFRHISPVRSSSALVLSQRCSLPAVAQPMLLKLNAPSWWPSLGGSPAARLVSRMLLSQTPNLAASKSTNTRSSKLEKVVCVEGLWSGKEKA